MARTFSFARHRVAQNATRRPTLAIAYRTVNKPSTSASDGRATNGTE